MKEINTTEKNNRKSSSNLGDWRLLVLAAAISIGAGMNSAEYQFTRDALKYQTRYQIQQTEEFLEEKFPLIYYPLNYLTWPGRQLAYLINNPKENID
ncbi:MAG TPA: hypothetical protein VJ208_03635 [Candidatus Nanoarchaeia archaeon]|nr:hypothetical protein [Candidatus Nanoarchaeia archaeon]